MKVEVPIHVAFEQDDDVRLRRANLLLIIGRWTVLDLYRESDAPNRAVCPMCYDYVPIIVQEHCPRGEGRRNVCKHHVNFESVYSLGL